GGDGGPELATPVFVGNLVEVVLEWGPLSDRCGCGTGQRRLETLSAPTLPARDVRHEVLDRPAIGRRGLLEGVARYGGHGGLPRLPRVELDFAERRALGGAQRHGHIMPRCGRERSEDGTGSRADCLRKVI